MIKLSADRIKVLRNEVTMACKVNEEELQPVMRESLRRYVGDYTPAFGGTWDIILNEIYPVIQSYLPSIFFQNPKAFLKPRNKTFIAKQRDPISGKMVDTELDSTKSARTQEDILNYTISEIKFKKEARKVLLDSLLFPFGVMWHGYKGDFGMTEEQSIEVKNERVFAKRISPMNFIKDPSVNISNIEEARWVGRVIDIPYIDFIEDDKFDIDRRVIKGFDGFGDKVGKSSYIAANNGSDKTYTAASSKPLLSYADDWFKKSSNAKFVRVYELYVRPTKKEARDGKKGWIVVLTMEQEKPLRVNDNEIKAEGWPCKILEFNELPDSMWGIPDVNIYKSIADQKNLVINQQIRNSEATGKVWVGLSKEGASEEDIQAVQDGQNTIVTFDSGNPRDRMFVASAGGQASSELYLLDGRIQQNLEDKSGISDLKRGVLRSGEESATSVRYRMAGSSARPAYRQDIMSEFLKDSFHYINQLNKQFLPIKDAVRIIGSLDIQWSEKPTKEEVQADVDVDIDVVSMLPENPEMELKNLNATLMLMIQAMSSPQIMDKIKSEGKTFNLSPIIEQILIRQRIRNPDVFRGIKPDESQGYVSVQQIREAKENVNAALTGAQVPYPPTMEDDHLAKLEVYTSIQDILQKAGQVSDVLEQLMQVQMAMLSELQKKQANPGQQVKLPKPQVATF